jgi:hypothetical protein
MKKYYLILLLILGAGATRFVWSQRNCPSTVDFAQMQTQDPARYQRFMNIENFTSNYIQSSGGANYRLADPNGVIYSYSRSGSCFAPK